MFSGEADRRCLGSRKRGILGSRFASMGLFYFGRERKDHLLLSVPEGDDGEAEREL